MEIESKRRQNQQKKILKSDNVDGEDATMAGFPSRALLQSRGDPKQITSTNEIKTTITQSGAKKSDYSEEFAQLFGTSEWPGAEETGGGRGGKG